MPESTDSSKSLFSKFKDILWPMGGATLGLLVMPIFIDQYPKFFHENAWMLPVSTGIAIALFVAPLLFHHRVPRLFHWIVQKQSKPHWRITKAICSVVLLGLLIVALVSGTQ